MRAHFKPVYQLSAFGASMFRRLLGNPLRNAYFFHAYGVGNNVCMVTNAVNNRFCAEFFQFFTRKFVALVASNNVVIFSAVKKAVFGTIFTAITNIIGKTTMTNVRKRRARSTKQTAY